jgi:hypothetical protein
MSYGDLKKIKGRYDGACQEVENRRKKTESSFDHGKNKAQSAYQQQIMDMHNVKVRLSTVKAAGSVSGKWYKCADNDRIPT